MPETESTETLSNLASLLLRPLRSMAPQSLDACSVPCETTGYGAAWKRGDAWSVAPNPIPVNHVTRAGFLWRSGEAYRLDPTLGSAPAWWIPVGSGGQREAAPALDPDAVATRTVPEGSGERVITLEVRPGSSASAHAMEERLSAGFTASEISDNGTFLPGEGVIRWGPFFDNQPRTLRYRLGAPEGFTGEIALIGLVSADGSDFPISGTSVVRFGSEPLPPPVEVQVDSDRLAVDIRGPLNARVIIETAESLSSPWTVATEFRLDRAGQDWSVPIEILESGRFFRIRVEIP